MVQGRNVPTKAATVGPSPSAGHHEGERLARGEGQRDVARQGGTSLQPGGLAGASPGYGEGTWVAQCTSANQKALVGELICLMDVR